MTFFLELAALVLIITIGIPLGIILGLVIKKLSAGRGAQSRAQEIEETEMIQDVYHGLQKMEQRVEALETLLLDKERKDKNT